MSTGNPNQVRETLSSSSATNLPPVFLPSLLMPRLCSFSLSLSPLTLFCSLFAPLPTWCASLSRTKIAAALFRLLARPFSVSPCTHALVRLGCALVPRFSCTPLFSILSMTIFQWTIQWTSSPRPSCVYASRKGCRGSGHRVIFLFLISRRVWIVGVHEMLVTKEFRNRFIYGIWRNDLISYTWLRKISRGVVRKKGFD